MMRKVELAIGFQENVWDNWFCNTDLSDEDLQDEQKLLTLLPEMGKEIAFVHLMHVEQDVEE